MSQDKDLRVGDIKDLPLDDERPARRGGGSGNNGGNGGGKRPPEAPRPRSSAARGTTPAAAGNLWMIVSLVLLALLLVLSIFFYREISTVRGQMDAELARSTEQLSRLSAHLSATDETFVQSSDKVQETLDFHMSEIRKLWAVSNERNRGWIQENQRAIKTIQDQRGELQNAMQRLTTDLAALKRDMEQGNQARNQLQTRVGVIMESLQQVESELASQERTMSQVVSALPQLNRLAQLEREGEGVAARLKEIEAAIAAFDAYRRQVNNRLDRLDGGQ